MPSPPWLVRTGIDAAVERWLADERMQRCFVADRTLPADAGAFGPIPDDLHPGLRDALAARGIRSLYQHQLEAIAAARAGNDTVVATPTASGKSLCFHLPVLDTLARDPAATAIYLYPTKALSRDQEASLRALAGDAGLALGATVYDGDTPGDARRSARQSARIVLTNPDMLHSGILPHHAGWARLMQSLRYVVIDELHTYRGVFGSHVAHVLERLTRIARFHGAEPTFICATATIHNPGEHAARLLDVPRQAIRVVDRSTAPRGSRRVLVYNPPVVNAELGVRASYLKSAVRLVGDLLEARVRTLLFAQSRNAVEIMLKYLRDRFEGAPALRDAIVSYRGGYLPDTRRRVERGLREGELLCVVATNALELGIDVGELDAVVCAGYPGSIAETWQRLGRAGRRGEPSLGVLVASSAPLDQYLAGHPVHLLDGAVEEARIDPANTEILVQHLKCAAFELPFQRHDRYAGLAPDDTEQALVFLADHGVLHRGRERFHWAATDAFPANQVSLRRIGWDNFVIIDVESGEALAELDWHSTPTMLHEQAIYQHEGEQFQVERLDYENHKAYVRKVVPDYFTTAMRHRKVNVLEESATGGLGRALYGWGEIRLVEQVVGYKKVKFHSHENAGYGDVRLPEIEMHTTSFWLTVPEDVCAELDRAVAVEGLKGVAHALELTATLALMCDPHDIGRTIEDESEAGARFAPTAYLFDNVPCGVGLAERIHERARDLSASAAALIAGCACRLGCPSCVGATAVAASAEVNPELDRKSASLRLILALGSSRHAP